MAWWLEKPYPKIRTAHELMTKGGFYVLDPEQPPEDTQFPGMKNVFLKRIQERKKPSEWTVYKCLMTERDIARAITAMESKASFFFAVEGDNKFPSVVIKQT